MVTAQEIYQKYSIPSNLELHMLQAAAVGETICQAWKGTIQQKLVVSALLIHDLGNIVKFDLQTDPYQLIKNSRDKKYWQQLKALFRERYGTRADQANLAIAQELKVSQSIIKLLENHHFSTIPTAISENDFEHQVVLYSDMRIAPQGLTSITKRITDLRDRYQKIDPKWRQAKTFKSRLNHCLKLEAEINQRTEVDVKKITAKNLQSKLAALREFKIEADLTTAINPNR